MHSEATLPTSSTTATTHRGGATPITALHPDIIRTHILNRLDGPTLASASCASTGLLSLCNGDDHLWRRICNATWPSTTASTTASAISSFPSGYRSFYSDSFPALNPNTKDGNTTCDCERLISAVDIFYEDELVCSKVLDTKATSFWFLSAPFRLDLLDPKETVPVRARRPEETDAYGTGHFRVSWILIDPILNRAVNVASREAVEARRQWLTDDVRLRFATVMAATSGEPPVQCAVQVTCGGGGGEAMVVREVSLQVEDVEGRVLAGSDSLIILQRAMEGQRRKYDARMERDHYERFLKTRLEFREMKERRERNLDMACVVSGVLVFSAILVIFCCCLLEIRMAVNY